MITKKSILFLIFSFCCLNSNLLHAYSKSPYVTTEVWNEVRPYLLPEDHLIKSHLDQIFNSTRATLNQKTLEEAGFIDPKPTEFKTMIVTKHKRIKGYLVKLYTDEIPSGEEWQEWKKRVVGAKSVQAAIVAHGYENIFKVPKKWIYPLPSNPSPPQGSYRQNFILVVEDMKLKKKKDNYFLWRSIAMTPEKLDAVYTIVNEEGLMDSLYPNNLTFAKDGKLAFIDLEYHRHWPINFDRLTAFLSPPMQKYWLEKIKH